MDDDDFNKLYLISYLVDRSKNSKITGYSDLAARLEYLKDQIKNDGRMNNEYEEEIRDLVVKDEEQSLDWTGLKDLINRADNDDHGSMFLEVNSKSIGPNKWIYEFSSKAPTEILENKLKEIIGSENETRFLEKVSSAAQLDDDDIIETIYNA